jgi:hypothetical protein
VSFGDGFSGSSVRGEGGNFPVKQFRDELTRRVDKVILTRETLTSKVSVDELVLSCSSSTLFIFVYSSV